MVIETFNVVKESKGKIVIMAFKKEEEAKGVFEAAVKIMGVPEEALEGVCDAGIHSDMFYTVSLIKSLQ